PQITSTSARGTDWPVGLFGVQTNTIFTPRPSASSTAAVSSSKPAAPRRSGTRTMPAAWIVAYTRYMSNVGGQIRMLSSPARQKPRIKTSIASPLPRGAGIPFGPAPEVPAPQRDADDAGGLDRRIHAVHVERRRADQDAVLAGAAEAADQDVDRLAAAARDEHLLRPGAVVLREAVAQREGPRGRVDVQPALRLVAGRAPRRLVRVEAHHARLPRARHVRAERAQIRPRQIEHAHPASLPRASSRVPTARACASSPSSSASVSATGPMLRRPSAESSCTVIERMKSPTPRLELRRA